MAGVDPRAASGSNGRIMMDEPEIPDAVLAEYGLESAHIAAFGNGLINQTYRVQGVQQNRFVLQRVNPIFPPEVNCDIDIVTRRLATEGLLTPLIVPTRQGALWVDVPQGTWRLLTYIEGVSHDALSGAKQAGQAGALLARFHRAVADLDHRFANQRLGIHDTSKHLRFLEETLTSKTDHPRHQAIAKLGREILDYANALPELPGLPDRVVHGDPKINNIIFDADTDEALCLIDLDTMARMPLPLEFGDAFRSWCNASGEDGRKGEFSTDLFAPAVEGYASEARGWVTAKEWSAIVPATEIILIELASRFCADALNECYFAWDAEHFASHSEHNIVRATSQLAVARSLAGQRQKLEKIVEQYA
jgi:Ser/Thr protein kinase RdoA (MazF antagonist)